MSEEMGIFETMYNCRAMRRLDKREVPQESLEKLIEAANQAPSGSNTQNARWIIVRDPTVKAELAELNRIGVENYLAPLIDNPGSLPHQPADKRKRMADAVVWQKEHMHEIPALIIACMQFPQRPTPAMIASGNGSIWPGIQNLLLAARALQLGAAPTTLALIDQQAVAKVLNLPETMATYCLIPVGYPLGNFGPVTRKPLSEIMRYDQWSD
ncbi:MAG: nitroreductase family protein [Pseudomonadota bacterium]|nr:nitroreductase family protein [Pseudomonadota bacterium]MEC9154454.1 nitroreductase family protein [Pseudomonadota bacterium]MED5581358.1 nitroreductase family protein [Pseudomonadota bacterium]